MSEDERLKSEAKWLKEEIEKLEIENEKLRKLKTVLFKKLQEENRKKKILLGEEELVEEEKEYSAKNMNEEILDHYLLSTLSSYRRAARF